MEEGLTNGHHYDVVQLSIQVLFIALPLYLC